MWRARDGDTHGRDVNPRVSFTTTTMIDAHLRSRGVIGNAFKSSDRYICLAFGYLRAMYMRETAEYISTCHCRSMHSSTG